MPGTAVPGGNQLVSLQENLVCKNELQVRHSLPLPPCLCCPPPWRALLCPPPFSPSPHLFLKCNNLIMVEHHLEEEVVGAKLMVIKYSLFFCRCCNRRPTTTISPTARSSPPCLPTPLLSAHYSTWPSKTSLSDPESDPICSKPAQTTTWRTHSNLS